MSPKTWTGRLHKEPDLTGPLVTHHKLRPKCVSRLKLQIRWQRLGRHALQRTSPAVGAADPLGAGWRPVCTAFICRMTGNPQCDPSPKLANILRAPRLVSTDCCHFYCTYSVHSIAVGGCHKG